MSRKKKTGKLVRLQYPEKMKAEYLTNSLHSVYPHFNADMFKEILNSKKPLVSVAMLSFIRTNKLLAMLDHWEKHRYAKTNLALRVQGSERMNKTIRRTIMEQARLAFNSANVIFTPQNKGSGEPRHQMIHEALKFNTPYIMTTDDDMYFPLGSIELLVTILDEHPELGAIDLNVSPYIAAWMEGTERMLPRPPKNGLDYCDGMGSATTVYKREVFDTCDYDSNYYVGWGDIDLCMQMKRAGWKTAILSIPNYVAINDAKNNPPEYQAIRYNKDYARNSADRFLSKWGIKIGNN